MTKKRLILCVILMGILLITPVSAKIVTAKVDDKGIVMYGQTGVLGGTLHTEYGEILVNDEDYNKVDINDTIRYDTKLDSFWMHYWDIEVIK